VIEVDNADVIYEAVTKRKIKLLEDIRDADWGARMFTIELPDGAGKLAVFSYKEDWRHSNLEPKLDSAGKKFAVVVSRFNAFITERLLSGALLALKQTGASDADITIMRVPGAFEIPSAARELALSRKFAAVICLGCLLRGDTLHYDVIANEVTRGIGQSSQETGVPHGFGVLTCDTLEQAIDRAGLKAGNKGYEAALAAIEMAGVHASVKAAR
jgi:6,7-dimethyl-8-ribityllumazine synthase